MRKFYTHFILLPILTVTLTSCIHTPKTNQRFYSKLMETKKESLERWGDAASLGYVGLRTGMILEGAEFLTLTNSHVTAEGSFRLNYRIDKDHAAIMTIGSAVPIRPDGYFLTAQHCVDGGSDTLVSLVEEKGSVRLIKTGFRVVWISEDKDTLDLALIHADIKPFRPFEFVDYDHLKDKEKVAATGWSGLTIGDPNPLAGMAVGNLLSLRTLGLQDLTGDWRMIRHTVPLHPGDSGGPVVNENGHLIGINSKVHVSFSEQVRTLFKKEENPRPARGYIAYASAPDLKWLESIIQADREKS